MHSYHLSIYPYSTSSFRQFAQVAVGIVHGRARHFAHVQGVSGQSVHYHFLGVLINGGRAHAINSHYLCMVITVRLHPISTSGRVP